MNYKEVSLVSPAVHEISGFLDQMTVALLAEKLDQDLYSDREPGSPDIHNSKGASTI